MISYQSNTRIHSKIRIKYRFKKYSDNQIQEHSKNNQTHHHQVKSSKIVKVIVIKAVTKTVII